MSESTLSSSVIVRYKKIQILYADYFLLIVRSLLIGQNDEFGGLS